MMPTIDLRNYIVNPSGDWVKDPDAFTSTEFILSQENDEVTFTGPVAISVTLQSENRTLGPSGADEKIFYHDVYTYGLAVPPGHTYRYRFTESRLENSEARRVLGVNFGSRVLFRPGLVRIPSTPVMAGTDLPCDFAVSAIANSGQFFPAGCEPCPPGVPVGLPPGATPTLVPAAPGGCVRTRFFNGMFITREDMETEQRFFRMKNKLQNRAMGQGVVWGLNLNRYSNNICIEPGYAVDCCGNDLVVTEPYRVNIDALLRDPATFRFLLDVAGRRSSVDDCDQPAPPGIIVDPAPQLCRRMHLLLEYVECPQDARPVHGDPCSPEISSCEMSRIRETVRLRLVPPRDYNPTGPIDKFLEEVKAAIASTGLANAAPGSTIATSTSLPVPFQLDINAQQAQFLLPPGFSGTLMPDRTVTRTLNLPNVPGGQSVPPLPAFTVKFQARTNSGYSVSAGQVIDQNGNVVASANSGSAIAFEWSDSVPAFPAAGFPAGSSFVDDNRTFSIQQWQAAPATGQPVLTGTTPITLAVRYTQQSVTGAAGGVTIAWSVSVGPTEVQVVVPTLGPYPCNSEACGCDPNVLRFPVFPPFLHNDPRTGGPVDWKVLLLAVLYGLLVSEEARHHTGTPQAVVTPRLQLAISIYVTALRALFGANTSDQQERLTRAMRCLFQAWCKALLYPGPQCESGIHGVVIGCAQIQGGRIVDVDPWGGRRWVVHYPLLAYWGHQFGIAPLDVTASRLFSAICCLGGLTPVLPARASSGLSSFTHVEAANATAAQPVAVGHVFLVSGTRAEALAQLTAAGVVPAATRELSLPEFVSTLLLRVREQPSGAASEYTLFDLKDSPDVHFAAPVAPEAAGASAVAVAPKPAAIDHLPELVHAAADAATRSAVPPLLRGLAETISVSLLRLATIARILSDPEAPLHKKLVEIGAGSYGAVAGRDPQQILQAVGTENAKELSQILVEAEGVISSVTQAVFHGIASIAKDAGAVDASDLNNEGAVRKTAAAIAHALANEKHVTLTEVVIAAVIAAAVNHAVTT